MIPCSVQSPLLWCPPCNKILPKKHLSLDFAPLSQKNDPFFSPRRSGTMSNSSCRHTWTILPQICQLTSQVYTGVTGRKERTLKPVRNPLCGKGWITGLAWTQAGIQQKILKLEVLQSSVSKGKNMCILIYQSPTEQTTFKNKPLIREWIWKKKVIELMWIFKH